MGHIHCHGQYFLFGIFHSNCCCSEDNSRSTPGAHECGPSGPRGIHRRKWQLDVAMEFGPPKNNTRPDRVLRPGTDREGPDVSLSNMNRTPSTLYLLIEDPVKGAALGHDGIAVEPRPASINSVSSDTGGISQMLTDGILCEFTANTLPMDLDGVDDIGGYRFSSFAEQSQPQHSPEVEPRPKSAPMRLYSDCDLQLMSQAELENASTSIEFEESCGPKISTASLLGMSGRDHHHRFEGPSDPDTLAAAGGSFCDGQVGGVMFPNNSGAIISAYPNILSGVNIDFSQVTPSSQAPPTDITQLLSEIASQSETVTCTTSRGHGAGTNLEMGFQLTCPPHMIRQPRSDTSNREFKCPYKECKWAFKSSYKLARHLETHKGIRQFCCNQPGCDKEFSTVHNLRAHLLRHETEETTVCPYLDCGVTFKSLCRFTTHLAKHQGEDGKKYRCSVCSRLFLTSAAHSVHENSHKRERVVSACRWCDREFTKKSTLLVHERTHTGEKPFKCPHDGCRWSFPSQSKLNRHKISHESKRKFVCSQPDCHQRFMRLDHAKQHMISHMGTRPYTCPEPDCLCAFSAKSSLYVHTRKHLNNVKMQPSYSCPVIGCRRHYMSKDTLEIHLDKDHTDVPEFQGHNLITYVATLLPCGQFDSNLSADPESTNDSSDTNEVGTSRIIQNVSSSSAPLVLPGQLIINSTGQLYFQPQVIINDDTNSVTSDTSDPNVHPPPSADGPRVTSTDHITLIQMSADSPPSSSTHTASTINLHDLD